MRGSPIMTRDAVSRTAHVGTVGIIGLRASLKPFELHGQFDAVGFHTEPLTRPALCREVPVSRMTNGRIPTNPIPRRHSHSLLLSTCRGSEQARKARNRLARLGTVSPGSDRLADAACRNYTEKTIFTFPFTLNGI